MLGRSIVASMIVVLVVAGGGSASPAAPEPANGRIVFGTFGRLIVTNPDGTGQWPLTAEALTDTPGGWSPDGTRLAVVRSGDIYLADPRGRIDDRVTFVGSPSADPSFSPDGTKLVFERSGEIWTVNIDGSSPRRVATGDGRAADPAWSPDGGSIAWTSFRDGNPELYVGKTDGSGVHRLTWSSGVDENRAPSLTTVGSSVTSKSRCSHPRSADTIVEPVPTGAAQEYSAR